jgi:importin-4
MQALQDPSPRVQVGALQASSRLLVYLSSEKSVLTFQDLILPSLAVAQACAARGDEESVRSVLEVFSDLSLCPMPVLKPYMGPVSFVTVIHVTVVLVTVVLVTVHSSCCW